MGKEPRDRDQQDKRRTYDHGLDKRLPSNDDGNRVTDWDKPMRPHRDQDDGKEK